MRKLLEAVVVVEKIEEVNRSVNGNPAYFVTTNLFAGRTASDASCAYALGLHSIGRVYKAKYHYTEKGNLIIDYFDEMKEISNASKRYMIIPRTVADEVIWHHSTFCRNGYISDNKKDLENIISFEPFLKGHVSIIEF